MSFEGDRGMMVRDRTAERFRWVWLVAFAVVALGCAPTTRSAAAPTTPSKDASAGVDFSKPRASQVSTDADADNATELLSSIRKVTVYSDRALVTRLATATVSTEPTVFAFKKLPGWVDDGSVRISTNAGRILDVRVNRSFLARANDEAFKKAEDAAQVLASRMAALDDELAILEAQAKQIEEIKAFSLEKLTQDMTAGKTTVKSYGEVVKFISSSLRDTAKARRAVDIQRIKLAPKIEAAEKKVEEMRALTQLEETTVYVTLQGKASASANLELNYMLPGATWEPMHEFRFSKANPKSVAVTSYAVVTQATGEDWNRPEMTFSTQSSADTVRIPELEALTLGDTKTATEIIKRQSASFSRAQAAFDSQNRLWNKRLQKAAQSHKFEEVYQSNFEYLQIVQGKTVEIFQTLRKRGTTAHFRALDSAIVRADGHSVRLPIVGSRLTAKQKIVAAPEQSLNAALTLDMLNETDQPLLPGKVAMYQDGAFLGMTEVDFVADSERFALFFSVADHLKLSRVLDKKHSALIKKRRTRMKLAFIVTVENLSSKTTSLTLADRIPVSENRDIVISKVKVTPAVKPDSKGILRWPLTLKPKEKRTFNIQYQIDYPPTLVLETKRDRAREPYPSPAGARPPKRRAKQRLEDDIVDYEQMF